MVNAFTVDLEDWFCTQNLRSIIPQNEWDRCEVRVIDNTHRLLDLLHAHRTEATFFVLGWIAERFPSLIRRIHEEGHEIASHGYSHTMLTELTPEEFSREMERALFYTGDPVTTAIKGFRAPSFTVTKQTEWAFDVLRDHSIHYDSSIYPISIHPEYGYPESPLDIHHHTSDIVEVPMSCADVRGRRIPCSGGGYFRWYPYGIFRTLVRLCNGQGRPLIFYIHPWEIDPDQPRVRLPLIQRLRHYHNLHSTFQKLEWLLNDFQFTSLRNLLADRALYTPPQIKEEYLIW